MLSSSSFRTDRLQGSGPPTGRLNLNDRWYRGFGTPLWLLLVVMAALSLYATWLAAGQWDRPIPGLLTDPLGRVLNYGWPSWGGYQQGLSFPDKITSVNGKPLPEPSFRQPFPAMLLDQALDKRRGSELQLLVTGRNGHGRAVGVHVERVGLLPWLVLFGGYLLLAWIWLLSAGLSYVVRPDSKGVSAFIWCALCVAMTLITLFDWHTTRRLTPLFVLSCSFLPAAVLEMSLRYPDDVEPLRRYPGLIWLLRLFGLGLFATVAVGWMMGHDFLLLSAVALGCAFFFHALMMTLRCIQAEGKRRTQLLLGLLLWLPPYLALSWMLLLWPEHVGGYMYVCLMPFLAFGTLGLTYALVRYDLWDSRMLLPRPVLRPLINIVMGAGAGLLAAVAFVGLLSEEPPFWQVLLVFLATTLLLPVHRRIEGWLDGRLFPADAYYRPTVEQLTLRFIDLASKAAVVEAVETTVRQWLPCERVRFLPLPFVLPTPEDSEEFFHSMPPGTALAMASGIALSMNSNIGSVSMMSSTGSNQSEPQEWRTLRKASRAAGIDINTEQSAALCSGKVVHPGLSPAGVQRWGLLIPARFREHVVGVLAVSTKRQQQLFNSEDENLLRTIANQAALALACANAYEQVESLNRAQQRAFREEKGAALGTVAAEIAHEIRFPINFFRMLLESYNTWLSDGKPPEAEDVEIGREEVDRLERMAGNLRRIATTKTLNRHSAEVRTLVDHVRLLLRDRLTSRMLEIEVDPLLDVDCDKDAMMQILVNLIANALDACAFPGRVGVVATGLEDGRLRLTVWDMGTGLLADIGKLFQPWFTTKKTGTGLGLPITRRLVRAHGWEITASRRTERTCFDVLIPQAEWHMRPPPSPDENQFESGPLK